MEDPNVNRCSLNFMGYSSHLAMNMSKMYESRLFCDVIIAAGGQQYPAHKIVLSCNSPYFKQIILSNPSKHPTIVIADVEADTMEYLLQFIYLGSVNLPINQIYKLFIIGKKLKVLGLEDYDETDQLGHLFGPVINVVDSTDRLAVIDEPLPPEVDVNETILPTPPLPVIPNKRTPKNKRLLKRLNVKKSKPLPKLIKLEESDDETDDETDDSDDEKDDSIINMMEPIIEMKDEKPDISTPKLEKYQYINTLPENLDDIRFFEGSTGKMHLLVKNYVFHRNTVRNKSVYWLCAAYQTELACKARCVSVNGVLKSATGIHNHRPTATFNHRSTDAQNHRSTGTHNRRPTSKILKNIRFSLE